MINILISIAELSSRSMLSFVCNIWKALFTIESSMEFSIRFYVYHMSILKLSADKMRFAINLTKYYSDEN